ncbi:MAG TPA: hypothetical protein VEW48_10480 [Thermoanaerobaculia bacterium]|nr:hypothetical protein [Thermoanaerobaculia bacterium]
MSYPLDREKNDAATPAAHYDYSRTFSAAEQKLNEFFAEGRVRESSPEELLAELAPLPQHEQERWVRTYSRFADSRLVLKLIEMSKALRYESTARRLHLAKLAMLAAETCSIT